MSCRVDLNTYQWSLATTQLLYSYTELLDIYCIIDLNPHLLNIATNFRYSYLEVLNINSTVGLNTQELSVTTQFLYSITTKGLDMSCRVGLSPHKWNIALDIVFEYS